uniref:Uncharacterized protein n=1 Tax=Glossina austeni TaxID=7395 RepID=A0A1A9VCP2_GLOAU
MSLGNTASEKLESKSPHSPNSKDFKLVKSPKISIFLAPKPLTEVRDKCINVLEAPKGNKSPVNTAASHARKRSSSNLLSKPTYSKLMVSSLMAKAFKTLSPRLRAAAKPDQLDTFEFFIRTVCHNEVSLAATFHNLHTAAARGRS